MNVEVAPHDVCKLQPIKLYKNVQAFFCQARKFEVWKTAVCHFWANVFVKTVSGPSLLGPLLLKSCMIRFSQYVFLETTSTLVHCRKLSGGHQVILILTAEKTSEPEKFMFDLEIILSNIKPTIFDSSKSETFWLIRLFIQKNEYSI